MARIIYSLSSPAIETMNVTIQTGYLVAPDQEKGQLACAVRCIANSGHRLLARTTGLGLPKNIPEPVEEAVETLLTHLVHDSEQLELLKSGEDPAAKRPADCVVVLEWCQDWSPLPPPLLTADDISSTSSDDYYSESECSGAWSAVPSAVERTLLSAECSGAWSIE